MPLVECVPNFSEGRDKGKIETISQIIRSVEGVNLLDVDPGQSTNRTVFTFVGEPELVCQAAFLAIKTAANLIDMRLHKGAHPRIGATDVCPFIPISGLSMEDCANLARKLAQRVGDELAIPVYLYAEAANCAERRNLADIRQGEYENLAERIKNGFKPDFGPNKFNPSSGATVIGARPFLIAYNVNLNTRSQKLANEIALSIREAGRAKRDENGKIVKDNAGQTVKAPGILKSVKAVGWYVEEYKQAQISINLTDYKTNSLEQAFDECCKQAKKLGLRITGSEIVGMLPLEPMLQAGKYFLHKQGRSIGVSEKELIETAILSLGLSDVTEFDPRKKIIEYATAPKVNLLRNLSLSDFSDELASDSPAPGGGSVAALSGALAASLSSMVANLTHSKKGFEHLNNEMNEIAVRGQELKELFLRAIDEDTNAFNNISEARRLPKDSEKDKQKREESIENANKEACLIPFKVLKTSFAVAELANKVASKGNPNCLSDAGVAGSCALTAGQGALYNVLINVPSIHDKEFVSRIQNESQEIYAKLTESCKNLHDSILKQLTEKK